MTMSPDPSRPIITLEEHFLSRVAATAAQPSKNTALLPKLPGLWEHLTELGPQRLADMDAGGVTMQVISHGPGDLTPDQCRECNDQLAAAVRARPARFAGFADLPMTQPDEAAAELRRTCRRASLVRVGEDQGAAAAVKFVGALVDCHTEDHRYYDGPQYDVLWRAASEDLDVPIYLHPTWPSDTLWQTHTANNPGLPDAVTGAILAFGFGWHSEVAMHILRLYAAGVFDRFPRLQIIMGHMGEMIPYMLQRVERVTSWWGKERSFREVWDSNIWVTTSGNWSLDPMACMLRNTKRERIMYSVDYPFAKSEDGLRWLQELEDSAMVSPEELEGIRWKNAARLLKLDIKAE